MPDQVSQPQTKSLTVDEASDILNAAIKATESRLPEVQRFELHQREARLFALSGLFADIKGTSEQQAIAQAFVKIDLGESIGLSSAEAMTGIDIIQGRVAISANIRAARMQRAGYDWDVLQLDNKGCRLQLKFKGQYLLCEEEDANGVVRRVPVVVSFTEADASLAGLLGKDNYKKHPRNMYFARAITNAQRWYAPGILSANILTSEEVEDLRVTPESILPASQEIIDQSPSKSEAVKNIVKERAKKAGAGKTQEPSAAAPSQTQETTPSTAPQTGNGSQGGMPEKPPSTTSQQTTGGDDNPDAEPAGDLFAQVERKETKPESKPGPVAVEKPKPSAPPPLDDDWG